MSSPMTYQAYLTDRKISQSDQEAFHYLMMVRKAELEKRFALLQKQLKQMEFMRSVHDLCVAGLESAAKDLVQVLEHTPKNKEVLVEPYREKLAQADKLRKGLLQERAANPDYLLIRKFKEIEMVQAELNWIDSLD
jgi:hypothetical protein